MAVSEIIYAYVANQFVMNAECGPVDTSRPRSGVRMNFFIKKNSLLATWQVDALSCAVARLMNYFGTVGPV